MNYIIMGIIFRLYFLSRTVIQTAYIIREHTLRSDWHNSVYQIQNPQLCRGNLPQQTIFLNEILINPKSATLSRKSTTIDHFPKRDFNCAVSDCTICPILDCRNVFINPTQYKNVIFSINQHIFSNSVRNNRSHIFPRRNKGNEFCPNKPRHLRR